MTFCLDNESVGVVERGGALPTPLTRRGGPNREGGGQNHAARRLVGGQGHLGVQSRPLADELDGPGRHDGLKYLANPQSGPCPCFEAGQVFTFERTPENDSFYRLGKGTLVGGGDFPCGEAWDAISR